jgi:rod shape-determining protein MreD
VTTTPGQPGWAAISVSLLAAGLLLSAPVPLWAAPWQPPWLPLVVAYWCLAQPDRLGITAAFVLGLLQDALTGTPLGQHALALAPVAAVVLATHQRVRVLPLLQQALLLAPVLAIHQLILALVTGSGGRPVDATVLLPTLSGALIWPWLFLALRDLRRSASR